MMYIKSIISAGRAMKSLNAWILYNGSLRSRKFAEHIAWLQRSLERRGVAQRAVNNGSLPMLLTGGRTELRLGAGLELPDFAVFWDKDVRLAEQLEAMGLRLFNPSEAVRVCDDKSLTHIALANQGIRMPKTIVAPLVFPGLSEPDPRFLDYVEDELMYPMVVKECFGSFGAQVYLASTPQELRALHERLLHTPHLYQEFVASSRGRDVRMQVVGDEAVASVKRTNEYDFRANVTNGGRMDPFDAPEEFTDMALRCARIIGADFAGVDMLFGPDGEPVLCEVNSNAHFKNLYHCTGVDVAERMVRHMLRVMAHD
jgi:gamma-F420-2:alpha-L-glutamate ligase